MMSPLSAQEDRQAGDTNLHKEEYYRDLRRRNVLRLLATYVAPLILLSIYFYIQYDSLMTRSQNLHLRAVAENQANTFDLFLTERLVNLANLIDDPKFRIPPRPEEMVAYLSKLIQNSETFVDLGFFDSLGVQTAYSGPFPSLERRNYSSEAWYLSLRRQESDYVITDIYLGFRQQPHFTIAVSRIREGQFVALRATLDPSKIYEYISSLEGAAEVYTSIVNREGFYQVVTSHIGTPLETSSIVPPREPALGVETAEIEGSTLSYGYSWLRTANWAVIVQLSSQENAPFLSDFRITFFGITLLVVLVIFLVIVNRANKLVTFQIESDRVRGQLEHAAKLVSVGELAAGIAHEINNPLAVINEEAGLIKDLMSSDYGEPAKPEDLTVHLDNIQESVFRCRDITHKLLGFVRKTDMDLKPHDVGELIDGVVDGLLGREMAVSNIEIIRDYDPGLPKLVTDKNQLQQVILNLINNSIDAIGAGPGNVTITTGNQGRNLLIAVTDTGKGMTRAQQEKVFLPFFTTKEVGKGTGLGLSVSYGIVKSLGGRIQVESSPGKGCTFTITLPVK